MTTTLEETTVSLKHVVRIVFPDAEAFYAAHAAEAVPFTDVRSSERFAFDALYVPPGGVTLEQERTLSRLEKSYGALVVEDYRYDLEQEDVFNPELIQPDDPSAPSLFDVLPKIQAEEAWEISRGGGATIAIVDTGIDGSRRELPAWKRVGSRTAPGSAGPWTDSVGHGTMCAVIAAGTRRDGGEFDGVAPDSGVIECQTTFDDADLTLAYEYLLDIALKGGRTLIISNSYGRRTGSPPPPPPPWVTFPRILNDAISAGIAVFFSAGNYHMMAGGAPEGCTPTSIWTYKCRDDVLTVATCDMNLQPWWYSSRGPGQNAGSDKPDVTAPTPANGRIVYGSAVRTLPDGWGTSGACPQAAGLAALMESYRPGIASAEIRDAIRDTAIRTGQPAACEGRGILACRNALEALV